MHTRNQAVRLVVVGVLAWATSLQAQSFDVLFRVSGIKGTCQVKQPGASVFIPATTGKAYPFGTTVRTGKDGEAFVLLSAEDALHMSPLCELTVTEPEGAPVYSNRTIRLEEGKIDVSVRDGLAEKALVVETGVASGDSFVGRCSIDLQKNKKPVKDKLDLRLLVHTDNGAIRITGPQFSIPKMRSGSAARIESSADRSITRIINESNDYTVNIDNGTDAPVVMETTTLSTVRIYREHAAVGGKLVVSVLETAPNGTGKGNFAYVLGEPALTTSGLPAMSENSTGSVATATAPAATTAPTTNAPPKEESLFK